MKAEIMFLWGWWVSYLLVFAETLISKIIVIPVEKWHSCLYMFWQNSFVTFSCAYPPLALLLTGIVPSMYQTFKKVFKVYGKEGIGIA